MSVVNQRGPTFVIDNDGHVEEPYSRKCIHNMLEAVLERAWRDALGTSDVKSHTLAEAREWFHNKGTKEWTFLWIAEELQLTSTIIKRIRNLIPLYSRQRLVRSGNGFVMRSSVGQIDEASSHTPIVSDTIPLPALRHRRYRESVRS